jgi:hypothetical protein
MTFPPIWMPSYPASGAASASRKGDVLKPLVNMLTGWTSGSKNYHMSIRNKLKRCHAVNTPTAVCTNAHPLVSVGPQNQAGNFNRNVIMVVRNFATAHEAMIQDKAFAYHGATEQMPVAEWQKMRDEWTKSSYASWKSFFTAWASMTDYKVVLYVQYERLMHPDSGIEVVMRLADALKQAGLQTAPPDQVPCIWYNAVVPEYQRLENFYKYEPAYTDELKVFLQAEVEQFIHEIKGTDEELVAILQDYLFEIQHNLLMDKGH